MGEKIKVGYSVDEETNRHVKQIAEFTHRADSHVIDWLVAEAWDRMKLMIISAETPAVDLPAAVLLPMSESGIKADGLGE